METQIRKMIGGILLAFALFAVVFSPSVYAADGEPRMNAAAEEAGKASVTDAEEEPRTEAPACQTTGEHVWGGYVSIGDGKHSAVCELCGESMEGACVYAEPRVYQCNNDGTHSEFCTLCRGEARADCTLKDETALPTQTEAGQTTHTCEQCGYTYADQVNLPEAVRKDSRKMGDADHSGFVDVKDARSILRVSVRLETVPEQDLPYADLDADGKITSSDARLILRTCVKLDPIVRHDFNCKVKSKQTCEKDGAMEAVCRYCGIASELAIPAPGHSFVKKDRVAPTCTKDGKEVSVCSVCNKTFVKKLKKTGHDYEETLIEATCTKDGSFKRVCRKCGDVQTEILKAAGHQWVEATAKEPKHCAACGEMVTGWTEVGDKYYYFAPDGTLAVNQIADQYYVDEKGVRSNDDVIAMAVNYVNANGGDGTNAEKLKNCYYAMVYSCRYTSIRGVATAKNLPQKASAMFKTSYGHCYSYASMFAYIAKVLGYSVRVNSGLIRSASGYMAVHGWTEIKINNVWYMFDVTSHIYRHINGYMRTHKSFPIYHTSGTLFYLKTVNGAAYWTI